MAGLVFRVCMGGPNISGVQISCDKSHTMLILGINLSCNCLIICTGVEDAMLHNDIRIKTQYDRLDRIPFSELQSLITVSYGGNSHNRIYIPNATFSATEDQFRY